ncbi:glycosyltransferase [Plantactinospora sp. KBS50]|uniref:CgeB family protein n=1 Tax=Plantactinospora sp. KBS50 TaxID=2024580 RepID=UPI0012FD004A|nr:glycosyltransferase [Plantactinospora sp. KBS50]
MKLGIIGPQGPDTFATNIGDAAQRMGHQVVPLGSGRPRHATLAGRAVQHVLESVPDVERRLHARLARAAQAHECDAVLSTNHALAAEAVAELRRARIPVALWYPDAVVNMGRQWMLLAPYSVVFTKDPLLARRLRDTLDINARYLPQACNPRWHRPMSEPATERTIVVAGNVYPSRLLLLRRLHEAGIPLSLYGAPVPRYLLPTMPPGLRMRPPIFREDKSRVFRGAAAVLNNLHPGEMTGVNLRTFEATGAGAAVLCEDRPVLADLYDPGREIVSFTTVAELIERARELLDEPRRTAEIGDAATKRAHAEHTYEHRLPELFAQLS